MPWPPALSARWAALALFLFALALHLFVAVGGAMGGMDLITLIVADEIAAILAAPVLVALLLRIRLRDAFLFRSSHWSHYAVAAAAAIPLQLFGGSLQELTIEVLPGSDAWRKMMERALEPLASTQGPLEMALLLLGGVVLAAVCEEVLFRGLLLQLLARGGSWRVAVAVTAVLFALFHLDVIGLIPRTVMGAYFALLVWRSGSIFPAMLAHGANNLLAFAALPLTDPTAAPPTPAQAGLYAVGAGLAFAVVMWLWVRLSPAPTPPPVGPARRIDAGPPSDHQLAADGRPVVALSSEDAATPPPPASTT